MKNNMILGKLSATALCASMFSFGSVSTADAALESRLGGAAYYDTDLNITWAADANMFGSGFWPNVPSKLSIDGVTGWQLPTIAQMEHLFVAEGVSYSVPHGFVNIQSSDYWSSEIVVVNPDPFGPPLDLYARAFNFADGHIGIGNLMVPDCFPTCIDALARLYSLPIHSGDVALIPEPQAYAMLLAGLGLLGFGQLQWRRDYLDDSSH